MSGFVHRLYPSSVKLPQLLPPLISHHTFQHRSAHELHIRMQRHIQLKYVVYQACV
ncbi:hypothetical protein MPER_03906 [Moniliophthora perniciosa FA553]|nr:hypothetical protein MPER_03906 [Moniliophthora perniciosa FA553]